MTFARDLWHRIETIHAVTYFDPSFPEAADGLGVGGFWRSYFAFRAAPLGPVGPSVVEATFFNFAPAMVHKYVPEVWGLADPAALVEVRSRTAVAVLGRCSPEALASATGAVRELAAASERASVAGRALFAANRDLGVPEEPVAALWQLCTNLREHRGDGHNATVVAAGIDGLEAHVLISADNGTSPADIQRTRAWTEEEWAAAAERLVDRGLLGPAGHLTLLGRTARTEIESATDRLATEPWHELGHGDRVELLAQLEPLAREISASGLLRYPNPIGLPAFE